MLLFFSELIFQLQLTLI